MKRMEKTDTIRNKIDTRQYVSVLRKLVEEGHQVGMTIIGTSMQPFLVDQRDEIFFQKPQRKLRAGDMVFYQRLDGRYVMHRICKKKNADYFMAGDHQNILEGPIAEEQIFAVVTDVKRKGRLLDEKSFVWRFYAVVWRYLFPVRGVLLRGNSIFQKIGKILCRIKVKYHD